MRSLLHAMQDSAVLLRSDLGFMDANRLYLRTAGLKPSALAVLHSGERSAFDVLSEDPEIELRLARECVETNQKQHSPWVVVKNRGGEAIEVVRTFIPISLDGATPVAVLVIYRDSSDEAKLHEAYREKLAMEAARGDELEREVAKRTQQLRVALDEVTRLAQIDPLTDTFNRRAFTEDAEQALSLARRHGRHCGLLMCDLDFFKAVNDTYGHTAGDALLVAVAGTLKQLVRESDRVARFGGEEFVVFLSETSPEFLEDICERCRRAVEAIPAGELVPSKPDAQTVSIGAALFPTHADSLDGLILAADKALYAAKDAGRNRAIVYSDALAGVERHKESDPDPAAQARVLLVNSDPELLESMRASLERRYAVSIATSSSHGLAMCQRQRFDVLVAGERLHGGAGSSFLRDSLATRPSAMRILILDSEDEFMPLRETNLGRVDHFILQREVVEHLPSAIEDGLVRRELVLQELLTSADLDSGSAAKDRAAVEQLIRGRLVRMAYQPIVDARTREVVGHEALCRPQGDLFESPAPLFETALVHDLIWELGDLVRTKIADELDQLTTPVFVNLHPAELSNPSLLESSAFGLGQTTRVIYEITERASIGNFTAFRDTVLALRRRGFRFAIDDLGAGYASLNSIVLVSPEFIKVDMGLIRDIHLSHQKRKLLGSLVQFANEANIKLIAEGVESAAEAEAATLVGCHLLQGYFFGKPALLESQ